MQTLYIDVYFLINFTVDLISLHLASEFSKIKINGYRLIIFTTLLSLTAIAEVFLPGTPIFSILVNLLCIIIVFAVPKRGTGAARRSRFLITSYILLMLVGGIVFAVFTYAKRYVGDFVPEQSVNRKLLMLSIIILISVGCVKIFVSLLKDVRNEKHVVMQININERKITVDSFVDTGNLLKDPIDMTPVMLLKERAAKELFPLGIPKNIDDESCLRSFNVRLIPIKNGNQTEIRLGFRPSKAVMLCEGKSYDVNVCFIIDNERGSFGGYDALVPASLVE